MDKQQAIAYIHQRLDQDATREEIVRLLVEKLHAPEAMVTKFVAQVDAEYQKEKPQSPPHPEPAHPQVAKLPPWLEEMTIGSQPGQPELQSTGSQPDWMQQLAQNAVLTGSPAAEKVIEPIPDWAQPASVTGTLSPSGTAPAAPSWEEEAQEFVIAQIQYGRLHSDIADELADRVGIPLARAQSFVMGIAAEVHSIPPKKITNTTEAADFVLTEYANGRPKMEIAAELATRTGEPLHLTQKFTALSIDKAEKAKAQEKRPPVAENASVNLNNPELVKFVVAELTKQRKRSDVVMEICERTGVHWSEAQRFVGQVMVEQRSAINARKNRFIIPMCIGAIILGFVFAIGTAIPMIYLVTGRWAEFYSTVSSMGNLSDYINAAPYIFGTGIVLIAGGIIGLVVAIQSQME
jgi:hypothetical protein